MLPSIKTVQRPKQSENIAPPLAPAANKIVTRAAAIKKTVEIPNQTALKPKEPTNKDVSTFPGATTTKRRLSNEFEKTEESLYSSALEDM